MLSKRLAAFSLILAAIIAIAISIAPDQAFAEDHYHDGDPCPRCETGILVLTTGDNQHGFYCLFCDFTVAEPHYGGKATCTEGAICDGCGGEYDNLDPGNHSGTSTVTGKKEATCTEAGYTGNTVWDCCGKEEKGETIPALGHAEDDPVRENETAAGYDEVIYCTACGEELSRTHVANKATLTFDLAGGTLDGKTGAIAIEANVGDTVKLPGAPTREGYTFKCWKGSEYAAGAEYEVPEGGHEFTAEWEKDAEPVPSGPDDNEKSDDSTPIGPDDNAKSDDSTPNGSDNSAKSAVPATGDGSAMLVMVLSVAALGSLLVLAGCATRRRAYRGKHSR